MTTEFAATELMDALKAEGIEDVECEDTGGGVAVLSIDKGFVQIGPGGFGGPAIFDTEELTFSVYDMTDPDDPEEITYYVVQPGTSVPDVARQIAEAYRSHIS